MIPLFESDLGNYRPQSLMSLSGKCMEATAKNVIDGNVRKVQ